jgi:hypothetical protein
MALPEAVKRRRAERRRAGEVRAGQQRAANPAGADAELQTASGLAAARLREAAIEYAERGIPVFPLQLNDKVPLPRSGGHKDATTDLEKIKAWWNGERAYNIGIPTGEISGYFVLDIDRHGADGFKTLADLEAQHGPLPATLTVETAGGGEHRYFTWSHDLAHLS